MKKTTSIILALATSFCFGFAFNTIITKQSNDQPMMKKVTGIGGIFFKCKDPNKIETVEYGKFVYIIDIEANKVELWEQNDIEYEKLGEQLGRKTTK